MMPSTFDVVQRVLFFALLGIATVLFLWVLRDFALPLVWAVVFAVVLYPLYKRILKEIKDPTLATLVTMLITLVGVFVPLFILGSSVTRDAIDLYQRFSVNGPQYLQTIESSPLVGNILDRFNIDTQDVRTRIVQTVQTSASWIAGQAFTIGLATFSTTVKFILMLYVLFFLLRDGDRLGRYLQRIIPLGNDREQMLFTRFASTTRAMVKGTLIVSLAQGLVGGILFWIAGIPNPALWGSFMAFLALIPAVGPALVWLPAGLILFFTGDVWQSIVVLAGGAVIISLLDNILRPILVGRDTELPDALVLLSILGGLASFGIAGIFLGPVIAALFLAVWTLFEREYKTELSERG